MINEWISVKDKPPMTHTTFLVFTKGYGITIAYLEYGNSWYCDQYEEITGVTHWQELPEPPEDIKDKE